MRALGEMAEVPARTLDLEVQRFTTFLENLGVRSMREVTSEIAEAFIESRRSDGSHPLRTTMWRRRDAIRHAYRAGRRMGLVESDPTLDVSLEKAPWAEKRPFADDEIEACRASSLVTLTDLRSSILQGLAETGATTAEMAHVRVGDVDLEARVVWLPGSTKVKPRCVELTAWGLTQIARRFAGGPDPSETLVVWKRGFPRKPVGACGHVISQTIRSAGLRAPDTGPRSITAWAGRRWQAQGHPIDEVARRLGMRSLDVTASLLRYDWRRGAS